MLEALHWAFSEFLFFKNDRHVPRRGHVLLGYGMLNPLCSLQANQLK